MCAQKQKRNKGRTGTNRNRFISVSTLVYRIKEQTRMPELLRKSVQSMVLLIFLYTNSRANTHVS
jgi:hypothetical protein